MKMNKQTLFAILICFALIGKSMSHDKPSTPSSKKTESPSSSPSKKDSDTPNKKEKYISSDSPASAPDSDASGRSSSVSFTKYLKEKYGDQSKTKYNPTLQKICDKTHDSDVCLATISPLLKNKKEFDAARVLEASLKVSKESIKDVVEKIGKQAKESPKNAGPLKDCKKHYNQALDDLHETLEAIRAKNYGKVNVLLSGVVADVSTAESKIVDLQLPKFKVEPFSFATVTASNSLSIASLVGK